MAKHDIKIKVKIKEKEFFLVFFFFFSRFLSVTGNKVEGKRKDKGKNKKEEQRVDLCFFLYCDLFASPLF